MVDEVPEHDLLPWRVHRAVEHIGIGRRTLHDRVDLWIAGDRSPRAIKGARTNAHRGDRGVDPLDAERVRLQQRGKLDPGVNAEQWQQMVRDRNVPWLYVTMEPWFREIVGMPPED